MSGAANKSKKIEFGKQKRSYYADMMIMLIAPTVMAFYFYGSRVLTMIALSVITAVICDLAGGYMTTKQFHFPLESWYTVFTGAAIALMLPASSPLWLAPAGSAFAIIVAKLPFGHIERVPFVPAAAGMAFLCVCWPELTFTYPLPDPNVGVNAFGSVDFVAGTSLASMLRVSNSLTPNKLTLFSLMRGDFAGPMGATCMLVMFGTALYFLIRHADLWLSSAGFVAACSVCAVVFPRVMTGRKMSLIMEISAGMLVFVSLFLLPSPSRIHKPIQHQLGYGLTAGIFCMLFRYFGFYEEGACFAVLMTNAVWPVIENILNRTNKRDETFVLDKEATMDRKERKPKNGGVAHE